MCGSEMRVTKSKRPTLTLPCRLKSKTANEHTYPTPSTWTVNSRKKSMICGAQAGRESQRTKGVRTTESVSCTKTEIFIANSWPNSVWTCKSEGVKVRNGTPVPEGRC